MAGKFWRTGLTEMAQSFSKTSFLRACNGSSRNLTAADIEPFGSGVRAQALEPSGSLVDDFRFVTAERMIHVLNAPSPAATASLSIGETIANMALEQAGTS